MVARAVSETVASEANGVGSNPTRATNNLNFMTMIYANEKNRLYNMCRASIHILEEIWKMIEKEKMQNEQFILDWLDELNEISIRN